MDSFTMQKDLHPLFAPFCNLQSAHTISRRLWREVRISTSVARSQATARTNSRSQTPLEHLHRRRFASTSSSIYCCSWQEICHLSEKGITIYSRQSKDLPMLGRDVHVWRGADGCGAGKAGPVLDDTPWRGLTHTPHQSLCGGCSALRRTPRRGTCGAMCARGGPWRGRHVVCSSQHKTTRYA